VREGFFGKEFVVAEAVGWETPRGHPVLTELFTPPVIVSLSFLEFETKSLI
jgi:hypothetical protein